MASHVARQNELKRQLRQALNTGDDVSCWARIERIVQVQGEAYRTAIMKLLAVNSSFYSFIDYSHRADTRKAENWLLHEDEFYVHWIGSGPNCYGAIITGEELEADFFMYICQSDDSDLEEPDARPEQ